MEYLRVRTAAQYLGYSAAHIYALARGRRIGRRLAGYWVFTAAELDRYAAERELEPRGRRAAGKGEQS